MILERKKIELNSTQTKLIISGWGEDVYENTIVEKITYLSDNLKVKGYIAYPKNAQEKHPCIIWNRGGYGDKGAIDRFNARGIFGQMASWGYVVFASQYRGNDGGEGKEEIGGSDVNDILNLIPLAEEFDFADKNNWGIEGWSRGGMMTYLALLKNPNFSVKGGYASGVKCAVLVGAISNFMEYVESSDNRNSIYKTMLGEKDFLKKLEKRTIINFINKLPRIPYLLIHGGNDETVPVSQTIEIANKFHESNIEHQLKIMENGDHFLKKHRKEVDQLKKEWYDKYLK
ncbi:MAG TPA: prolyl oligopeptidase family serine peptidase [Ignavibacteriaceae bacterium]|nr:prolyl oligopeptidase family serine peptidase [Ignavibacteriaceae bacterium]